MDFQLKAFEELTLFELYRILEIRSEVFVVEQDCVYQDVDGKDLKSHHVLGIQNGRIEAYTRIVPPDLSFTDYAAIGRVITTAAVRGNGFGIRLMEESVRYCKELYPKYDIKISAQKYLLKFYNGLGFNEVGEGYLEDGIPHIGMIYTD